ncbi:hypothetical protein ISS21_02875 [Patescibacteria group bacterium]|nr:hypothetical protein [Patescibacteria group bacterium]
MKLPFKLWSSNNPEAIEKICPDLGMREWNDLNSDEKQKIWAYFFNKGWFNKSSHIFYTIETLNERYKRKSYGRRLLEHGGPHFYRGSYPYGQKYFESCCLKTTLDDFEDIFLNENQDVVYEILSLYVLLKIDTSSIQNIDEADKESRKEEIINHAYEESDKFAHDFNDIFEQFSLNVVLTRNGIIFRQDKKITEEIYVPVLSYLSGKKWIPVNRDLTDAFRKFQEKTPQGYSGCITHAISALQGFLQILVHGKIGKGDLSDLLPEAQKKKLIPSDPFSTKTFKDLQSILMQKRQESGDPHPKKEYANEQSAKLVMNLIMIFIQHCIVNE